MDMHLCEYQIPKALPHAHAPWTRVRAGRLLINVFSACATDWLRPNRG
jgi:hypothetical protein